MNLPENLSAEEAAKTLSSLLARFKDAGWLSSYAIRAGTLDVKFTDLGSSRILELHQIFQKELPKLSNQEFPVLAFLAAHYGPRIDAERQ